MKLIILLITCQLLVVLAAPAQPVNLLDSLTKKLEATPNNDTNRVIVLNELSFEYRHSRPELTYSLARQAYTLSRALSYPPGEARALASMAAAYKFLGDYAQSLTYYKAARDLNQQLGNLDRVAVILNNTADLYIQQEEWEKGLASMRDCFAVYNKVRNPKYSQKEVYFTNLAECLYHLNQLDSASIYLNRALPIALAKKETVVSAIYYLLGDVASAQHRNQQAYSFYQKTIQNATQQRSYSDLYEGYYRLAQLYQKTGNSAQSLHFAGLALTYARKGTYLKGILTSSQYLSTLYQGHDDTESLRYYKVAVAAKDSLYSQDKVKRLLTIDFEEKEQAQQMEIAKAAYQNRVGFIILVGILSVFASLAFILYRNNQQKKKANQLLQDKNEEIEKNVVQLKAAQVLLAAKNAENELLVKEIHHRVKNNLEVVSSLLALQSDKISDPNVKDAMLASRNRVQSMGIIHQKLYQGDQLATIEMRDYFINLSESILDSFDADGRIRVECSMPELVLDIDTAISVGLITNELLTNSLKYAFTDQQKGTVSISLTRSSAESLLLEIADDGIGKQANALAKGTGFGTQLIELLTRQLDGVLTYENRQGTLVKLCFKRPIIA